MEKSLTAVWPDLVEQVALRWRIPSAQAETQMVAVIRHAVFDPALTLIISAIGLLQMSVPVGASTYEWLERCRQSSQDWLANYRLLEASCSQRETRVQNRCQCLVDGLGTLFTDSETLQQTGQQLIGQLPVEEKDEAYEMLLRALGRLTAITNELAQDDVSWLWRYIESKPQ